MESLENSSETLKHEKSKLIRQESNSTIRQFLMFSPSKHNNSENRFIEDSSEATTKFDFTTKKTTENFITDFCQVDNSLLLKRSLSENFKKNSSIDFESPAKIDLLDNTNSNNDSSNEIDENEKNNSISNQNIDNSPNKLQIIQLKDENSQANFAYKNKKILQKNNEFEIGPMRLIISSNEIDDITKICSEENLLGKKLLETPKSTPNFYNESIQSHYQIDSISLRKGNFIQEIL